MKNFFYLSIFFCSLFKSYSAIVIYNMTVNDYRKVYNAGYIYINLSTYPNNEYLFIQINYNTLYNFSNFSYSLKNETNFTNLKNVDFYIKKIKDKITFLYITFRKENNNKYLLIYFNLGYKLHFSIDSNSNNILQIPKYGNRLGRYNTLFYMNLTNFNEKEIIYIEVQFNITKSFSSLCLKNIQSDYYGRDFANLDFNCSNTLIKNNNFYIFYFQFVKKNKYIYLTPDIYYNIDVRLKNTKNDQYSFDKDKSKCLSEKNSIILIIILILSVILLIILFIYIFISKPNEKEFLKKNDIINNLK